MSLSPRLAAQPERTFTQTKVCLRAFSIRRQQRYLEQNQLSVICYGKPKLNGGSTIKSEKAKMTLVRTGEVTLSYSLFG